MELLVGVEPELSRLVQRSTIRSPGYHVCISTCRSCSYNDVRFCTAKFFLSEERNYFSNFYGWEAISSVANDSADLRQRIHSCLYKRLDIYVELLSAACLSRFCCTKYLLQLGVPLYQLTQAERVVMLNAGHCCI